MENIIFMKNLYMIVTADKYELPLFVSDSCVELSKITGKGINNIYSSISKDKPGTRNGYKFVRVPLDDEGDE